jgi:predicted dehydrogenase
MAGKISWGIIGTGNIAHKFARAVRESKSGTLSGIGSRSQETADKFGDEFEIESSGRYSTYEALLADQTIDAIYISTPHTQHAEWAIKAAQAGKHILCEKPITLDHANALAVVEAARQNSVFLMEAFMYRCHPQTARIIEIVRSGEIGTVRTINAAFSFNFPEAPENRLWNRALGGGGMLDVGCYPVSFAQLIAAVALGQESVEPLEVKAFGRLHPTLQVDEYTTALLKFEGDIIAQVSTGLSLDQGRSATIYGTKGHIHINSPWICDGKIIVRTEEGEEREEDVMPAESLYALEVDAFAVGVATGRAPFPAMTPEDTLGNMATLDRWRAEIGLTYRALI